MSDIVEIVERAINARVDREIARAHSYKAAGKKLAGEGAGFCDYAAKVLLEVRADIRNRLGETRREVVTKTPGITHEQERFEGETEI